MINGFKLQYYTSPKEVLNKYFKKYVQTRTLNIQ